MIPTDALPDEIRSTSRAVVWKRERRNGKSTKVPYQPGRPAEHARVDDPETWGAFDVALGNVEDGKADGVGFVLGDGIVGIDLDGCRDPETGELEDWAQRIVEDLDSYTEVSPSGTGLHILVRGFLPPGRRRRGPIEMYAGGRYFTVTAEHVEGTPGEIQDRTGELAALHARVFGQNGDGREKPPEPPPSAPLDLTDEELVRRASSAENGAKFIRLWAGDASGYDSASEADLALVNILTFWTAGDTERVDRLFRRSGLMREKWEREDYRARTMAAAMDGRTEFWEPGRDGAPRTMPRPEKHEEQAENGGGEFGRRDFTHDGLALALGDRWSGEARYVDAWGRWFFWKESVWREDQVLEHMTRARRFLRQLAEQLEGQDEKGAKKLRSAHTVARVVSLARSNEVQAATVDQWDADPYQLGHPDPEKP